MTDSGLIQAKSALEPVYFAENTAMCQTAEKYAGLFIEALEYLIDALKKATEGQDDKLEEYFKVRNHVNHAIVSREFRKTNNLIVL